MATTSSSKNTSSSAKTTSTTKTSAPTVNGKTFAQASAGVTDRTALGNIAKQFQSAGSGGSSSGGTSTSSGGSSGGSNDGIVRYNPNTGALLNAGETVINKYTGEKVTQGTKYIAASDLGKNTPDIPTAPTYGTDYNGILGSLGLPGATDPKITTTTGSAALDGALGTQAANFKAMLENLQAPPSMEDAYRQAQKESGIIQKQQLVNDLSGQLATIQANATANQLRIEGQGRGIPEAIIGGQQAQIAREAAIAALPVSAQLQAAQGNLEMAEKNLDTLFKVKSADLTAQYEFKNNLVKSVYDFASTQEKTKLDYAMKIEDRKYSETMAEQGEIKDLANLALKNGAPASILSAVSSAKTYKEALTKVGKYGTDPLDRAIKQLALKKAQSGGDEGAPTIKNINGIDYEWNGTGWVIPSGTSQASSGVAQQLKDKLTSIDEVIANKAGLKGSVGTTGLGRNSGIVRAGARQNFIAGVQQIVSQDTIQTLLNMKKQGGTLGALSDQERVMLQSAATKIGQWAIPDTKTGKTIGYAASEKDFTAELNKIKMLTERAYNEAAGTTSNYLDSVGAQLDLISSPYAQYLAQ